MTINQFKYIRAISKYRSFSKASEMLGITQPALTLQVKKLEQEVGFMLFNRTQKPLSVTKEGEIFLQKTAQILNQIDQLQDLSATLELDIKGTLTLGIIPTIAPYLVPLFMDDLQINYPQLTVHIKELVTEDIIDLIKNGELDAGIVATPIQTKGVNFKTLLYEKFYLFVSEKNKLYSKPAIKVDEIALTELWYLNEGNCFQNQVNALCKISDKITEKQNLKYQSNSIESLRYIVEHRGGITFIPELATLTIPPDQEDMIKSINGLQPVREISLVTARFVAKQKLIDVFVEVLMKNIPLNMKKIKGDMILDTEIVTD